MASKAPSGTAEAASLLCGWVFNAFEAPHLEQLRAVCDAIGYGRVIQVAERWMDEKHPGWLAARRRVVVEEEMSKAAYMDLGLEPPKEQAG
jgi:hypothetical protein